MELSEGFEPSLSDYKTEVLPLNYDSEIIGSALTRLSYPAAICTEAGFEPATPPSFGAIGESRTRITSIPKTHSSLELRWRKYGAARKSQTCVPTLREWCSIIELERHWPNRCQRTSKFSYANSQLTARLKIYALATIPIKCTPPWR